MSNIVKNRLLIIVVVLFFTLGLATAWPQTGSGVENPAIRNPVGLSTVPPSSIQSGLIASPNPIDASSNLVITGNIRRGRHFRGTMPYRSATSFGATLGSTSLQSFLRDSAGAEDFGHYAGKYRARPYYSPTETVTTTRPGRSGVFRPSGTRISSRAPDVFGLEPLPKTQALSSRDTSVSDVKLWGPHTQYSALGQRWSMSLSPQEIEQLARRELSVYRRGEKLDRTEGIRKQYQSRMEGTTSGIKSVWDPEILGRGLKQMEDEVGGLEQSIAEKGDSLRLFPTGPVSKRDLSAEGRFVIQSPKEQMKETFARPSALSAARIRGDEFTAARDSTLQDGSILWGSSNVPGNTGLDHTDLRGGAFAESLQQAPNWEGEPIRDEGIAESGKRDTWRLRTLGPLQQQGQREGFPNAKEGVGGLEVLERIRQQLNDLTKSVDARLQAGPEETRRAVSTERAGQRSVRATTDFVGLDSLKDGLLYRLQEAADGELEVSEDELYFVEMLSEIEARESSGERSFVLDELDELSQTDQPKANMIQSRAKRIIGQQRSFESFSETKFNEHIWAAEDYLRRGMYYRAADSFALASIYRLAPGEAGSDPVHAFGLALSLAGRGHALFAAGEYMSSALFISRAIEVDPEYARSEIEFVATLGGMDKLQSRIADVKEWLEKSDTGQLHFLLGYVYYRMGKLQEAKEAMDTAYERMPQSPAVGMVKKAIDDSI